MLVVKNLIFNKIKILENTGVFHEKRIKLLKKINTLLIFLPKKWF